jgi:hypothetical protein
MAHHILSVATSVFPMAWQFVNQATATWGALFRSMMAVYGLFWSQSTIRKGCFATLKGELDALDGIITMVSRWVSPKHRKTPASPESPSDTTPVTSEETPQTAHRAKGPAKAPPMREHPPSKHQCR